LVILWRIRGKLQKSAGNKQREELTMKLLSYMTLESMIVNAALATLLAIE
jgi:hypothetical protein